jgi:F-type H+-transporting ATPase subunit alpha
VGGSAQDRALKQIAGRLRIDLAQYQEMAQFVKFGAEVDAATTRQLARGERARELLKQEQHTPLPMEHEALILYAVIEGMLDELPVAELGAFEQELFAYADVNHRETMTGLRDAPELSPSLEADLRAVVEACLARRQGAAVPEMGADQVASADPAASDIEAEEPATAGRSA